MLSVVKIAESTIIMISMIFGSPGSPEGSECEGIFLPVGWGLSSRVRNTIEETKAM